MLGVPSLSSWLRDKASREESYLPARVPEKHRLSFREPPLAYVGDETRHRFSGVRRIEKDRIGSRGERDRLSRRFGFNSVAPANEPIVDLDGCSPRKNAGDRKSTRLNSSHTVIS